MRQIMIAVFLAVSPCTQASAWEAHAMPPPVAQALPTATSAAPGVERKEDDQQAGRHDESARTASRDRGEAVMTPERKAAIETYKRMAGDEGLDDFTKAADSSALLAEIPKLMMDFGMGNIWARPGLEMREKSMVTISILLATNHFAELKGHMKIGLHNGLTVEEIRDILVHSIPYVGFPPVVEAQKQLLDVLKEEGLESQYPHPRPWPGVHE